MDILPILKTAGYLGYFIVIFVESGLFFGVVLPGDTFLFAAGLLAGKGNFNIILLIIIGIVAAIAGDSMGYWIGKKLGPALFTRKESFFFRKEYVARAHAFFERHGKKTIFLARFVPIVRTFAPPLAGLGLMKYKSFLAFNIIGAIVWCVSILLAGYFLGGKVDNIDNYILPIVLGIFVLSFIPVISQYFAYKKEKKQKIEKEGME